MLNFTSRANDFDLGHIGWRYYNQIKKKAVEQEFSWSGLFISLPIAFFVVIAGASVLHLTYVLIINILSRLKQINAANLAP